MGKRRGDTDWTPELDDRLIALWKEGHSVAEISRRLGVSKSSVIGRASRIRDAGKPIDSRPSPIIRRADDAIPALAAHSGAVTLPPLEGYGPPTTTMPPLGPPRRCQYPLWGALLADDRIDLSRCRRDPRPGHTPRVCGEPSDGAWCARHHRLVFAVLSSSAEEAA